MTAVGLWTIGLALAYTLFLVVGGRAARARAAQGGYFVGARSFRPATVAFCITGLFSGSSFIAILELSYRTGVSALWYGVAEIVQILLIALLLVVPLRKRLVVTVSGLIGDRFGRTARAVGGAITAFAFPMWSVATAIAFATALSAVTGLSVRAAVVVTALLLLAFLWGGGMQSVAFTQTANVAVFAIMLAVAAFAVLAQPGWQALVELSGTRPDLADVTGAGAPLIVAWFGTFVVNVILAQAAFQMAMSCRTPEEGRTGLVRAAWLAVPFIVLGVAVGVAAALTLPGEQLGLLGVARYITEVVPAPVAAVFFLGLWACAIGWGGPCQFSGATSLGRDVGSALNPRASQADLVRYTRWSLVLLTVLMIVFGFLRTEESAWWNVLAWTLRNGATLAPVLAVLFWPVATRLAALAALLVGFSAGLAWYQLGAWDPVTFHLGVHPVWVGMSLNVLTLLLVTLVHPPWAVTTEPSRRRRGGLALAGAAAVGTASALGWDTLHPLGLSGLALFTTVALLAAAAFVLVRERGAPVLRTTELVAAEPASAR
ncbi:sodium:solute symporter family protein [Georgenia sp. 10Sc9-8]|uniref:Sodium:solute symporter family protein n=1 Tax=Georgenia halotolerans TaxID=3028317 RepID=A0ABT5TY07_9MICO|nr:sodium:solute symporter family protein [Georgenia halotolerans]